MRSQKKLKVNILKLMRVLAITLVLLFSTVFMFKSTASGSTNDAFVNVTICPGDTLWTLSKHYYPNENVQESIYNIMLYNNLADSDLHPGENIKIPVEI